MENSKIAWTNHTFNPWWGCVKVSPGCKNCYAEKFATGRLRMPVWGQDAARKIASEALWRKPLLWNKRAADKGVRELVFSASMADVFEDYQGPDAARVMEARERLWALIEATPREYVLKSQFTLASVKGKSWPHPVIASGRLYIRDQDTLLCYDVRKK